MTTSWFENADRGQRWLVGVSGGADSVALLHLLVEKGFSKLVVCHLNHRLRGNDSLADEEFVGKLALSLGLDFESVQVDVAKLAGETRESLETAARHARHEFFRQCAENHDCKRVILAHHADDQAETVLWNLLRGSHGLRGMREAQWVNGLEIHRPLLGWRRGELRGWLKIKQLAWREDSTNREPIAVRNRLRNEALPLLAEIADRDPVAALVRENAWWDEQRSISEWALEKADVLDPQGRLHVPAIRKLPLALQRAALAKFLGGTLDRETIERGMGLLKSNDAAVINLPGGRRLHRRAGRMFVTVSDGPLAE